MILAKPSWHNLSGEARLTARLEELERRFDDFYAGQYESWAVAAGPKGEALEARMAALEEKMEAFERRILDLPEVLIGEAELTKLRQGVADQAADLRDLEADNRDLSRRLDTALQLIEGLALAAGFARWSGDSADWPAWVRHVSGQPPAE